MPISAHIINANPQVVYCLQFIGEEIATISECPLCTKFFKYIIPWRVYLCGSIHTRFTDVRNLSAEEVKQGSQGCTKDFPAECCVPSWCLLTVLFLLPFQSTTNSPSNIHRCRRLRKQPASESPDSLTQDFDSVLSVFKDCVDYGVLFENKIPLLVSKIAQDRE